MSALSFCQNQVPLVAVFLLLSLRVVASFLVAAPTDSTTFRRQCTSLAMVRNIDLPEAIILYGHAVMLNPSDPKTVRGGLIELIQECHDDGTVVIVLLSSADVDEEATAGSLLKECLPTNLLGDIVWHHSTNHPPNPADLLQAAGKAQVQERAFGGSSGFGAKPADPSWRPPAPRHCVVLVSSIDQTRAARACGMRVVNCCDPDDPLADAVLFDEEIDFGVDDIATPGSFWLNPPHPRDDEGNKVDPYDLVELYSHHQGIGESAVPTAASSVQMPEELNDDDFDSILADLAPLKK